MPCFAISKPSDITEVEMKLLPRYCPDTMGFSYGDAYGNASPRAGYWVSLMGKDFWGMHHYCWAQINMNRSRKSGLTQNDRKGLWESARGDYKYVIDNSQSGFIMLPEVYTRLGEVELLLGRPQMARVAFDRARQLKPNYWPAYSHWAEFLIKTGQRAEALKVVTAGLEQSPNSKTLLELYAILGGKKSNLPKLVDVPRAVFDSTTETEIPLDISAPNTEKIENRNFEAK